jgi:hypothetical protein
VGLFPKGSILNSNLTILFAELRPCAWSTAPRLDRRRALVGFHGLLIKARVFRQLHAHIPKAKCQSASKFDPRSASNFDPLERRVLAVALAPSGLVGVAETVRARAA